MRHPRRPRNPRSQPCEPLEPRLLLTAYTVNGTAATDTITIRDASSGPTVRVGVKVNAASETLYTVTAGDSFTINGLAGANTYAILSTPAGILFNFSGGANTDTFNVTAGAGATATTIKGALNITGGAGTDALFYDDNYTAATGPTIDLSPFSIDRVVAAVASAPVNYQQVESVRIDMTDGSGVLQVFGTASGVTTTVNAGLGNDRLDIYPRQISVLGPGLGPPSLEGPLTWNGEGGNNTVRVVDADGQTPFNYTFTANATGPVLTGVGANVQILNNEFLVLNAGAAPDLFVLGNGTVEGLPTGDVTINAGGGNDSLEYRDEDTLRPGNPGETYTITADTITHDIDDVGSFTQAVVHYAAVESLRVAASQNSTNFNLYGTGAPTTLEGGGGDDDYVLGSDSLSAITHLLHLTGGVGTNTLTVNDTADPTGNILHVDALGFGRAPGDTLFPAGGGAFDSDMSNIVFNLSDAPTGDRVYLTPRPSTSFNINADQPGSGINGDRLTLALVGVTGTASHPITSGIGNYTFANRAQVSYTSVESRVLDNETPAVVDAAFRFDAPVPTFDVQFTEDVAYSLAAPGPQFLFTDTLAPIPAASVAMTYDTDTDTASFTFPGFPNGILPDANYSIVFDTGAYADLAGNPSTSPSGQSFFAFAGDANHDRSVNFTDLVALAQNYNKTGKTFREGDFNYDGSVNFADLVLLAQRYNTTLPAPVNAPPLLTLTSMPASKSADTASTKTVFSTTPVRKPAPAPRPKPASPARKKGSPA